MKIGKIGLLGVFLALGLWISCGSNIDEGAIPQSDQDEAVSELEGAFQTLSTIQSWINNVGIKYDGFENEEAEEKAAYLFSPEDYADWTSKCPVDLQGEHASYSLDGKYYDVYVGSENNGVIPIKTVEWFPFNPEIKYSVTTYNLKVVSTDCWSKKNIVGEYVNYVYYYDGKIEKRTLARDDSVDGVKTDITENVNIIYPGYARYILRNVPVSPVRCLHWSCAIPFAERYFSYGKGVSHYVEYETTTPHGLASKEEVTYYDINREVGKGYYSASGNVEDYAFENKESFYSTYIWRSAGFWRDKCRYIKRLAENIEIPGRRAVVRLCTAEYLRDIYVPIVKYGMEKVEKGTFKKIDTDTWEAKWTKTVSYKKTLPIRLRNSYMWMARTESWDLKGEPGGKISGTVTISFPGQCKKLVKTISNDGTDGSFISVSQKWDYSDCIRPVNRCMWVHRFYYDRALNRRIIRLERRCLDVRRHIIVRAEQVDRNGRWSVRIESDEGGVVTRNVRVFPRGIVANIE